MNVIGYLCFTLGFVSVISQINAINARNEQQDGQQLYNPLPIDDSARMKRPFCNAFTGCGKKRSISLGNFVENDERLTDKIRIPLPIYRALMRTVNRQIQDKLDQRSSIAGSFDEYSYSDLYNTIPSRKQYQS